MRVRAGLIVLVGFVLAAASQAAIPEQKAAKNFYPDPIERALERVRDPAQKVVFVYRELFRARAAQKPDMVSIDTFLAEALEGHHKAVAWEFTRKLAGSFEKGDPKYAEMVKAQFESPASEYDVAAFLPVLERLPAGAAPGLAAEKARAAEVAARLSDRAAIAEYASQIEATGDFYRRVFPLELLARRMANGVVGLVEALTACFSDENVLIFFHRVSRSPLRRSSVRAADAKKELAARMVEDLAAELVDRVQGGLGTKVQSIDLADDGLRIRTVLLVGHLRRMVHTAVRLEEPSEKELFAGLIRQVRDRARALAVRSSLDEAGRTYAGRVAETLTSVLNADWKVLSEKEALPPLQDDHDAIGAAVKSLDREGLFDDLP